MYNNNSNQLYNPNMNASRSAVDALLKDLGAEPLFSSISNPSPGIPTQLNGQNNNFNPPATSYNSLQTDQNTFSDIFVSLLQRINQQNSQNTQNMHSSQNLQNSQYYGEIQQNQNPIQSGPSNQIGIPNPISILNEMHQRHNRSGYPPKYSFTMDSNTGHFYCQLDVFGKIFKTERPTLRKQQAKEEAALMALRSFVNEDNSSGNKSFGGSDIMKLYESSFEKLDGVCKSENWYKKQLSDCPGKQPRVILLEFCQMHRLPGPIYRPYNDFNGNTYYECTVGEKCFKSDKPFMKSSEAKDYVASLAFDVIYKEICELERRRNGMGQVDNRSSFLNFIENNTTSNPGNSSNSNSNINSPHSQLSSPGHLNSIVNSSNVINSHLNFSNLSSSISNSHLSINSSHSGVINPNSNISNSLSNVINSHSGTTSPHSSITSSHLSINNNPHSNVSSPQLNINNSHSNVSSPLININSPHVSSHSNVVGSSHLNELTTSLVLPNFNHEVQNIKVEETNSLSPSHMDVSIIKTEEGNINYSTRDQQQPNLLSPVSYHPYRAPGRERFPQNPGFNNNQFTKKNTGGFCKKFTSLLYEMAQSKRWQPPEFNYENGVNGFVCVCSVQDYLFRGKACSRKMDAKESAAEEAYRFLTRQGIN